MPTDYQECAWCGGEITSGHDYHSRLGEVFCSKGHRTASNRALKRLTGRTVAQMAADRKLKLKNPTHAAGPGCFQWGNQKTYCGPGAEAKADRQGRAVRATGWKERNPPEMVEIPATPDNTLEVEVPRFMYHRRPTAGRSLRIRAGALPQREIELLEDFPRGTSNRVVWLSPRPVAKTGEVLVVDLAKLKAANLRPTWSAGGYVVHAGDIPAVAVSQH